MERLKAEMRDIDAKAKEDMMEMRLLTAEQAKQAELKDHKLQDVIPGRVPGGPGQAFMALRGFENCVF